MTGKKQARDAAGPLAAATSQLASWLKQVTGVAVLFGDTTDEQSPDDTAPAVGALRLWPLGLRPETQTRMPGSTDPAAFRVRHLVAPADAPIGPDSLRLLDMVLVAAVQAGEPTICPEPPDALLWLALGTTPRPGLLVDATAHVQHEPPATSPLVLQPLRLQSLDMRPLQGRVLGPGDQPVAGMRVTVAGMSGAAYTDPRGMFQFAAVPQHGPVRLELRGRNRSLIAQVEPGHAEPLVIRCDFEES
ncbi:hypothetical protein Rhe02_02990 [Rhizocola hellebori]|uniref:Carboxypeptidase regulatory-like domain-containing protein n=1 Tax=Rhizocola hellebori TaxID=1392758 RepID=A0A8J3VD88_9ACTN|nr:carboxypeptidase-like regulatory domain-containing protein [Rhizocola hellebori]GIH02232.1 hypothetical protein Rhe02_02990 [Rhizocola hellebori]